MSLETITRLRKDIRDAAIHLSDAEARYLVDSYYTLQDDRIRSNHQIRQQREEPHATLDWLADQFATLEKQIKRALQAYAENDHMGAWAMSHVGIGPVISAGLRAHIDITRAPTAGAIWRFAGLDPTAVWGKGERRPWNAALKVLCWKMGESFKKHSGRPGCFYGQIYRERKDLEVRRNDAGDFRQTAEETLQAKKIRDSATRARYESGKLPDGRLDLRAMRYAVKLFLSHYHGEAYRHHYGEEPPLPYPIAHMGHVHMIESQAG